jgi:hypothetical protein
MPLPARQGGKFGLQCGNVNRRRRLAAGKRRLGPRGPSSIEATRSDDDGLCFGAQTLAVEGKVTARLP